MADRKKLPIDIQYQKLLGTRMLSLCARVFLRGAHDTYFFLSNMVQRR